MISGHLFKRRRAYRPVVDAFRHYLTEPINRAGLVLRCLLSPTGNQHSRVLFDSDDEITGMPYR